MTRKIRSVKMPKTKIDDPCRNGNPKWRSNYTTGGWCRRRGGHRPCINSPAQCPDCLRESHYRT